MTLPLHKIAALLAWAAVSVYAAESAESIFTKSARLFSFKNLRFNVAMTIESGDTLRERSFMVAERQQQNDTALLIRFRSPQTIRCTALLIDKGTETTSNAVYFPALKRVRIIPEREEESEAVGMGISYAELNAKKGEFGPLEETELEGKRYYRVSLLRNANRSVYYIDMETSAIKRVESYKGAVLQRVVDVDDVRRIDAQMLITRWRVDDLAKSRKLTYTVDTDSISHDVNKSYFQQNRLHRCSF